MQKIKKINIFATLSLILMLSSVAEFHQSKVFGIEQKIVIDKANEYYPKIAKYEAFKNIHMVSLSGNSYDENSPNNIKLISGQNFTITLKSNPTTGYQWIPKFKTNIINLLSHDFKPLLPVRIGSSGIEIFTFKSLNPGTTTLDMVYKRGIEEPPIKEKTFVIIVHS